MESPNGMTLMTALAGDALPISSKEINNKLENNTSLVFIAHLIFQALNKKSSLC